ncbi:hypothetical protein DID88_000704 [Monilinia fructigena]|uniref:Uncharacterized protein n=1 Tax=Monilinia fructigena TaxID=38457 RepID=A0A395IKM7_9HELO|nr:hypothetical protein DID88_000704 [Monilinia fructigena]
MEETETFTLLPLHIDPQSKAISSSSNSKALNEELETLNALHRTLLTIESPIPPPPVPVNPKRSANITKLRESGNTEFRKQRHEEAIKFYTLGIQMALARPLWEPSGLVRDEIAVWAMDAESSVEAKRAGNAKAWWRRGRCLMEMGRLEEAKEWLRRGLEMENNEGDLVHC